MDEEFRKVLRTMQRAGGTFEQLNLETLLSADQLDELLRQTFLAKIRQANIKLVTDLLTPEERQEIEFSSRNCPCGNHQIIKSNPTQYRYLSQVAQLPYFEKPPTTLEELSLKVVKDLDIRWGQVEKVVDSCILLPSHASRNPVAREFGIPSRIDLIRTALEIYVYGQTIYLSFTYIERV